jgi:hypothetical protein
MLEPGEIKQAVERDDLSLLLKHPDLQPLNRNKLYTEHSKYAVSLFIYAAEKGAEKIINWIMKNESLVAFQYDHAIWWAALEGHLRVVKTLLPHINQNPTTYRSGILWVSIWQGHNEVVKTLLESKIVALEEDDKEALSTAALNGNIEIVKLLCNDSRMDVSELGSEALDKALNIGHIPVIAYLSLKLGASRALPIIRKYGPKEEVNDSKYCLEKISTIILTQDSKFIDKSIEDIFNKYINLIKEREKEYNLLKTFSHSVKAKELRFIKRRLEYFGSEELYLPPEITEMPINTVLEGENLTLKELINIPKYIKETEGIIKKASLFNNDLFKEFVNQLYKDTIMHAIEAKDISKFRKLFESYVNEAIDKEFLKEAFNLAKNNGSYSIRLILEKKLRLHNELSIL